MNKGFSLNCLALAQRFLGTIFKMQFSLRQATYERIQRRAARHFYSGKRSSPHTHGGHSPQVRGNGGGHFAGGVPRSQPRDGGLAPPATRAVPPQAHVGSLGLGQMSMEGAWGGGVGRVGRHGGRGSCPALQAVTPECCLGDFPALWGEAEQAGLGAALTACRVFPWAAWLNEVQEALRSVSVPPLPSACLFPSLPQPSSHREEVSSIFSGTVTITSLAFPWRRKTSHFIPPYYHLPFVLCA